jgi:hypothetical protein
MLCLVVNLPESSPPGESAAGGSAADQSLPCKPASQLLPYHFSRIISKKIMEDWSYAEYFRYYVP